MRKRPPDLTRLARNLVRCAGRPPEHFQAGVLEDGSIRVLGPQGAAFYPAVGWTSRFTRHLYQGLFDPLPQRSVALHAP